MQHGVTKGGGNGQERGEFESVGSRAQNNKDSSHPHGQGCPAVQPHLFFQKDDRKQADQKRADEKNRCGFG